MSFKSLRVSIGIDLLRTLEKAKYPEGFFRWMQYNSHIWEEFEAKALRMAEYRKRFSARTIIEVMRWHNTIRQEKDVTFKISNNIVPGLARLWMAKHGLDHPKFFDMR